MCWFSPPPLPAPPAAATAPEAVAGEPVEPETAQPAATRFKHRGLTWYNRYTQHTGLSGEVGIILLICSPPAWTAKLQLRKKSSNEVPKSIDCDFWVTFG